MQTIQCLFYTMGILSFLLGGCSKKPATQKSETTQTIPPGQISFTQLDITERFDDHLHLKPEDWIATVALNKQVPDGKGLPPLDAKPEDIYQAATKLSGYRESISIASDGVYCPICHIANTQPDKLHTPCPKCGRALLKFGWD